ncbi:MAG: TetR/AcrR family transcriptional regulator [Bacteroidota bacterium]
MSKRALNKEKIKNNLLQEAQRLFSEKGFDDTTVADIVEAADLGRGTFYNYFSDVKSIFDAVIDKINSEIQIVLKEARLEADNVYELLFLSYKSYLDFVTTDDMLEFHQKNQAYIRSTSYGSESIRRLVSDLRNDLEPLKEMGEFKEDYEIQLLSLILVGTPIELFLNIHAADINIPNKEMADFLAKFFAKAMKPISGTH